MPDSVTELLERPASEAADTATGAAAAAETVVDDVVDTDLLVEEISIDGMCGVY
jgi:mycofactocin precursor